MLIQSKFYKFYNILHPLRSFVNQKNYLPSIVYEILKPFPNTPLPSPCDLTTILTVFPSDLTIEELDSLQYIPRGLYRSRIVTLAL